MLRWNLQTRKAFSNTSQTTGRSERFRRRTLGRMLATSVTTTWSLCGIAGGWRRACTQDKGKGPEQRGSSSDRFAGEMNDFPSRLLSTGRFSTPSMNESLSSMKKPGSKSLGTGQIYYCPLLLPDLVTPNGAVTVH